MTHKSARFWNRHAKGYAKRPVGDQKSYEYKLAQTAKHLDKTSRVFELGCGTGTTALYHAGRVKEIDAIDISSEMIAIAREKAKSQDVDNVNFHVTTLENWQAEPASYDMVMAHSILHLVDNPKDTLVRLADLLKPGGNLVTSTVCMNDLNPLIFWGFRIASTTSLIPRIAKLSKEGLRQDILDLGFEDIETWHPPTGRTLFMIARKLPATH